jgi:hypothetical protein
MSEVKTSRFVYEMKGLKWPKFEAVLSPPLVTHVSGADNLSVPPPQTLDNRKPARY